jgi:hypothetical protein
MKSALTQLESFDFRQPQLQRKRLLEFFPEDVKRSVERMHPIPLPLSFEEALVADRR